MVGPRGRARRAPASRGRRDTGTELSSWAPDDAAPVPTGEDQPHPSETAVLKAISTVYDPEIPVNIYELGLIYAVEIGDDHQVKVEMTLTAPGCPSAQELPVMVQDAIMAVKGVTSCEVDTVWDPPWDPSRMTEDARLALNMF